MWNPYLGIHVFSFARFVFTAALLVWSVSSGQADGGPKDLCLCICASTQPACADGACPRKKKPSSMRRSTERGYGRACRSPKQRTFIAAREKPHIRPAALSAAAAKSCRASCTTSAPMPSDARTLAQTPIIRGPVGDRHNKPDSSRSALVPQLVPRAKRERDAQPGIGCK